MPSTSTGTRRRRAVPRLSAAALAAVLALSGCAGGTEIETGGEDDRFISGDGSATVFEAGEREAAHEVTGTTFDDEDLALRDYAGEILALNGCVSW